MPHYTTASLIQQSALENIQTSFCGVNTSLLTQINSADQITFSSLNIPQQHRLGNQPQYPRATGAPSIFSLN